MIKMLEKVDLVFNYGGEWVRNPQLVYCKKLSEIWKDYEVDHLSFIDICREYKEKLGYFLVKQLIVTGPSGNYYLLDGDEGIRALQTLLCDQFKVVNLFAIDELEDEVTDLSNITEHSKTSSRAHVSAGTDCDSDEGKGEENYESPGSDYDEEGLEVFKKQRNLEISDKLEKYKELKIGMAFKDIAEARQVVAFYSVANKRGLKVKKSDKDRLRYICQPGCPFLVYISRDGRDQGFSIKTLKPDHDCHEVFENSRADYKIWAHYFKDKLQHEPKYSIKSMKGDLASNFNLNVSRSKLRRTKRVALEKLEGSYLDDYNRLEAYAHELRESNPGSDVVINISKDALEEGKRRFLRMYVCLGALKQGWRAGLRPFIGLDGTFLKGKCKGELLVAVAQDSDHHFYPLAWALVDKETKRTWIWFMELLKESLDLNDDNGLTIMSDMQKGLLEAVKIVCPHAHHRFCVRHIESNWGKRWRSKEMRKRLWWSAWSFYGEEFKDQLRKLGEISENAAKDLVSYPVKAWCRAYFDTRCKNAMVDNNFTESFNSWILEARSKPIIKLLEDIRIKVMNMLRVHDDEARLWRDDYSPHAMDLYNDYRLIAHGCRLDFNGEDGFEVSHGRDRHTVKLDEKRCTCRIWDLTGIPCPHAIRAMLYRKIDPVRQIHWYYSKECFCLIYNHKLQPVRGEKFWKVLKEHAMEPPTLTNQAGRPRTKRKREKAEAIKRMGAWTASRQGLLMTCGYCSQEGHNIRRCPLVHGKHKKYFQDPPVEGPEPFQENGDFMFIPVPGMMPPPSSQASCQNSSRQTYTQQSSQNCTQQSNGQSTEQNMSDESSDNEDPLLRPPMFSEETRRDELKKCIASTGDRRIGFVGANPEPIDLPYEPRKLTVKGKEAMSSTQLQAIKEKKIGKLQARRKGK